MNFILRNATIVNAIAFPMTITTTTFNRRDCSQIILPALFRKLRNTLLNIKSIDADICLNSNEREWTNLYKNRHSGIASQLYRKL